MVTQFTGGRRMPPVLSCLSLASRAPCPSSYRLVRGTRVRTRVHSTPSATHDGLPGRRRARACTGMSAVLELLPRCGRREREEQKQHCSNFSPACSLPPAPGLPPAMSIRRELGAAGRPVTSPSTQAGSRRTYSPKLLYRTCSSLAVFSAAVSSETSKERK